jgi:hypothetical protein
MSAVIAVAVGASAITACYAGSATHYGESFHGRGMACGAPYDTNDPKIVAVGYALDDVAPCGARVIVCGRRISAITSSTPRGASAG